MIGRQSSHGVPKGLPGLVLSLVERLALDRERARRQVEAMPGIWARESMRAEERLERLRAEVARDQEAARRRR